MERTGRLIGKLKIPAGAMSPEELAVASWAPAVGKKIAAHTAAAQLIRGTLIVEVEDMVWQRQLAAISRQILRNVQEIAGATLVEGIAFRPMTPRRMPQRAEAVRATPSPGFDEADDIRDATFRSVYKISRKKATA